MAHLHNWAGSAGVVLQNIWNKVKQTAEIAHGMKQIYDIGSFFKNVMLPVAEVAAVL